MYSNIKIVFSPKCLEYESPNHPESPRRVKKSFEFLKDKKFEFVKPELATEEDVLLVHSRYLLESVREGSFFDADTPNIPGIFQYALLSLGGAIKAAKLVTKSLPQEAKVSFSLMRPPGHHATKNHLGGFCYFNNIAIATKKVLDKAKRIDIVDIDCHHGQGTEEIFKGDKDVFYLSLHQKGIYPGTGLRSEGNILNIPLESGARDKEYLYALNKGLARVKEFNPKLIAVSAGFDTYKKDPLTNINLNLKTYEKIGKILKQFDLPIFAVLEGGYSKDLPKCIYNFIKGLGA